MLRRGRRAAPAPEHLAGNGSADHSASDGSNGDAAAARAEALRADLAGIAARIGGLTGTGPNMPPSVETVPSELIDRLDRLAVMAEPGFATIEELRHGWDGIVEELTASRVAWNEEFGRAAEAAASRFEAMAADVDERHRRHLAELTEQSEGRLAALSNAIDLVHSRLDQLTEIAQPVPGALEKIRQGQGRLGAESADAILAMAALDERLRQGNGESTAEVLRRIDLLESVTGPRFEAMEEFRRSWDERLSRLESVVGPGFETIKELRCSWDELMAQATTSNVERGEELGRAVEAASARFEILLADLDHRHHRHLAELTEQVDGRLSGWSGALDAIGSRLDHLTGMAQQLPDQLTRLHHEQGRLATESTAAAVDALDDRIRQGREQSTGELVARLDMLASSTGPGLEAIDDLRRGWEGIVEQITSSSAARGDILAQAVEAASDRVEAMIADLDQRHQRNLEEARQDGDARLGAALDAIGSRLDRLTEITQPMMGEIDGLRHEQGRLDAEATAAVIHALDERLRHVGEESTGEILGRLDRLAAATGIGFDAIEGLQHSQDRTAAGVAGLGEATDAFVDRFATAATEALDEVRSRLDHLTEVAETVAALPESLERLRCEQDRLAAQLDSAVSFMAQTAEEVKQKPETPAAEIFEHMSRLGEELDGASIRLRETSQQLARDGQDRRGQMATLDLGLRVALTGMEAVVTGRQGEQVAQLKDAQHEVVESVLEALSRFGRQVDAGLQHATEELTTSVFLTHEDSDERSHAMQDDLTKVLARVEDAELERDEQLVDLRRVVDRLTREVQLLRPAIDLRGGPDHGLNEVALDRFADRVAALLSEEVLARLDSSTGPAIEVGPPVLRPRPA